MRTLLTGFLLLSVYTENTLAKMNLHLIDQDPTTGFAIYRTSSTEKQEDFQQICDLGIDESFVLSGNAENAEYKYEHLCPRLKVAYNIPQVVRTPVTESFLFEFDQWVEEAKKYGKKIVFRCDEGSHRTGRLAAYYQMKYMGHSYQKAVDDMNKLGTFMIFFPMLPYQVKSLSDYIQGKPCSVEQKHCVQIGK